MSDLGRFRGIVAAGLSVTEAAAIAGICRSTAYQLAASLGLVRVTKLAPAARREVLRLIAAGQLPLQQIAAKAGVSKTSVLRIRDHAARRGARQEGRQFRATRRAYYCPGCGARVRIVPCVACLARGATCRGGE
jgi:DNA-binding IclR family transcriptional regulator